MPSIETVHSQSLLEELKGVLVGSYEASCEELIYDADLIISEIPFDLIPLIRYAEKLDAVWESVQSMFMANPPSLEEMLDLVNDRKRLSKADYDQERNNLLLAMSMERQNAEIQIEEELSALQNELLDARLNHMHKLSYLFDALAVLELKRDSLLEFARSTGVILDATPLSIEVLSPREIKAVIDICIATIDRVTEGRKGLSSLGKVLYLPLLLQVSDDEMVQAIFGAVYMVMLIALILIASPYALAVISFLLIIQALVGGMNSAIYTKQLNLAYYLSTNRFDFEAVIELIIDREVDIIDIESRIAAKMAEDPELRAQESLTPLQVMLDDLDQSDTVSRFDSIIEEANSPEFIESLQTEMESVHRKYTVQLEDAKDSFENHMKSVAKDLERRESERSDPGSVTNPHMYMNLNFKTGAAYYKGRIIDYSTLRVPNESILFEYENNAIRSSLLDTMRVLLCNALGSVKEKFLYVHIFDQENLGHEFSDFVTPETSDYIQIVTKDVDMELEKLFQSAKKNIISLKQADINTYNERNEEIGKVTLEYHIIIILASTNSKIYENNSLKAFKEFSASKGYWIWILHPDMSMMMENEKDDAEISPALSEFYYFPVIMRQPNYFSCVTGLKPILYDEESGLARIMYTPDLGMCAIETLKESIKVGSVVAIDYETKYRKIHIPDDKIWTYNTLKGVELRYGFIEGDPSKPHFEVLGDNTPHALLAGTTGSGKSVVINVTLASMVQMYSPEWLNLVMVDFKNVEFGMYADPETKLGIIPHIKVLAGTKDGEYALSIFTYLVEELAVRLKTIGKFKFQNIEDYNTGILAIRNNTKEAQKYLDLGMTGDLKIIPRLVSIIDEFQAMFRAIADKILDLILTKIAIIAAEARAVGIHLWFTSQNMDGTIPPAVMELFKLRCCLLLTKDSAEKVFGNTAPSTIKSKGWLYTNGTFGDPKDNHLYRVPFAPNFYIKEYTSMLNRLCDERGFDQSKAYFFDEGEKYPIDELRKWNLDSRVYATSRSHVLGERTMLSRNRFPVNFTITKESKQHLYIAIADRTQRCNMVNTILINIEMCNMGVVMAQSASKDTTALLELHSKVHPKLEGFVDLEETEVIVDQLSSMVDARAKSDQEVTPIYVFLLDWDLQKGIGQGEDYRLRDRFDAVLQKAGQVDIHIVMTVSMTKTMPNNYHLFEHRIVGQVSPDTSMKFLEHENASKLREYVAYYKSLSQDTKFKIYQSEWDESKIAVKELYMEEE